MKTEDGGHTTNYSNTLIEISPDCGALSARVPTKPGTVATMQYEMISQAPYAHTSDDVIFAVHAARAGIAPTEEARTEFYSRGQACLRSSLLVKSYGFGVHHDKEGRVAIFGVETPQYQDLVADPGVTKVPGMRSKRR
ncbi:MAG: hypothetical protein H6873_13660 [Hyphomicrobiaceae bacterium]|nr:hypothetical protein [Hyphomicrobiaceae bacterium]